VFAQAQRHEPQRAAACGHGAAAQRLPAGRGAHQG